MIVDGSEGGVGNGGQGMGCGGLVWGREIFGERWGNGDFNHEWARIDTNGEGRGNGRDEGEVVRGVVCRGDFRAQ